MDIEKLSPAPWISSGDAIEYTGRQRTPFSDRGAWIYSKTEGHVVVEGGLQDEQGGAVGVIRNADAEFIALARNAFDVQMRRGWFAKRVKRAQYDGWIAEGNGFPGAWSLVKPDPFTALVEADKWYVEHVENKEKSDE